MRITNSVFWGNLADREGSQLHNQSVARIAIRYSNVEGGYLGVGNIDEDPLFVGSDDLRLQESSPCIDSGDPSMEAPSPLDLDGNPRLVDGDEDGEEVIDMGAFEYAPSAR